MHIVLFNKKSLNILFNISFVSKYYFYILIYMGAGQSGTATKWHGRQIDTVRHFGTEGHFGTATKWHGASLGTEGHFGTSTKFLYFNLFF